LQDSERKSFDVLDVFTQLNKNGMLNWSDGNFDKL
jgi:hypothetical protein